MNRQLIIPTRSFVAVSLLSLFCLGTFYSCGSYRPQEYKPYRVKRQLVPTFPYGHWAEILLRDSSQVRGELIAIDGTTMMVLDSLNQLQQWQEQEILGVDLWVHRDESIAVKRYSVGMTGASCTNGWFSVLTIPSWLIMRSLVAKDAANQKRVIRYPEDLWEDLIPYSRFPQGIPQGLDVSGLTTQALE